MLSKKQTILYNKVIDCYGGVMATARALDIKQGAVSSWKSGRNGAKPLHALKIMLDTGYNAEDLCPELTEIFNEIEELKKRNII